MAGLTICSACKKEIASDASACPHCGHHPTPQIGVLTGCLIILIVLIVAPIIVCSIANR
jgi:RNA polymerase subunit RPABC4/transcription elongation factor Spt4